MGGKVFASDINDNGQVVGWDGKGSVEGDWNSRGFFWEDGVLTNIDVLEGMNSSVATAIDNEGKVVGYSESYGGFEQQRFVWENNTFTLLAEEFIPGFMNNNGEIFGGNAIYKDGVYTPINLGALAASAFKIKGNLSERNETEQSFMLMFGMMAF
jgi:probable HAF family extracellular repeat protein